MQATDQPPLEVPEPAADTQPASSSDPLLQRNIPELDGLRSAAALLVILRHWVDLPLEGSLVQRLLVGVSRAGWAGVDLFFVLSGFLITGILLDAKGRDRYFRNFWGRRILRILPLYYAVVALFVLLIPAISWFDRWSGFWPDGDVPTWTFWAFTSNYPLGFGSVRHQFLIVSWSLCVEEHFYLFWPLIVFRYSAPTLERIVVGLLLFSFGARYCILVAGDGNPYLINFLTPTHLDGIALGSLLALLVRRGADSAARLWCQARPLLPVAAVAVLLMAWADNRLSFDTYRFLGPDYFGITFGILFFSLFFALLLLAAVGSSSGNYYRRALRWKPLARMGKLTFSMYLLHLPVQFFLQLWLLPLLSPPPRLCAAWILIYTVEFVTLLAICLLSWRYLEKPFLNLKTHFPRSAPADRRIPIDRPRIL